VDLLFGVGQNISDVLLRVPFNTDPGFLNKDLNSIQLRGQSHIILLSLTP